MSTDLAKKALKEVAKLVEKELNKPPRKLGEWRGECRFEPTDKPDIFVFHQNPVDPLRLVVYGDDGKPLLEYALAGTQNTDFGSIPGWAEKLASKVEALQLKARDYEKSYSIHDGGYEKGGLMVRAAGDAAWTWVEVTRAEMDALMYIGLTAEETTRLKSQVVYRAVRLGAGGVWDEYRKKDANA